VANSLLFAESDHFIDEWKSAPKVGELFQREQRDVSLGQRFAEALESGERHDRIAQPIDSAHH
jgi:hypothetical protein